MVTRAGAGLGSSILSDVPGPGTFTGAGVAGLGEFAAEALEGSPISGKRIGVEAALGAVPMGQLFKAGRVVSSGLKGGALSAVGEAGREWAKDEDLSASQIGSAGIFGGAVSSGLAKLLGYFQKPVAAPIARAASGWSEPTKQVAEEIEKKFPLPAKRIYESNRHGDTINPQVQKALEENFGFEGDPYSRRSTVKPLPADKIAGEHERLASLPEHQGKVVTKETIKDTRDASKTFNTAEAARDKQNLKEVSEWLSLKRAEEKASAARTKANLAQKAIDEAKEAGGKYVSGAPKQSFSKEIPGGRESVSKVWEVPEEKKAGEGIADDLMGGLGLFTEEGGQAAEKGPLDALKKALEPEIVTKENAPVRAISRKPFAARNEAVAYEDAIRRGNMKQADSIASQIAKKHGINQNELDVYITSTYKPRSESEANLYQQWKSAGRDDRVAARLAMQGKPVSESIMRRAPELPPSKEPPTAAIKPEDVPAIVDDLKGLEDSKTGVQGLEDFVTQIAEHPAKPPTPKTPKVASRSRKTVSGFNKGVEDILGGLEKEPTSPAISIPDQPTNTLSFEEGANKVANDKLTSAMGSFSDADIAALDSVDDFGNPLSRGDLGLDLEDVVPEVSTEPLTFHKGSRVDVSGEHYRNLKELLTPGDRESPLAIGTRKAGQALGREGQAAGLPPTPRSPRVPKQAKPAPPTPASVEAPPPVQAGPDVPAGSVTEEEVQRLIDAQGKEDATPNGLRKILKGLEGKGKFKNPPKKGGDETGEISLGPLFHIGSALAGGAIGAATDPFGNRLVSGLAGAGLGAAAPSLVSKLSEIGANPATLENLGESLGTPEGIKAKAKEIYQGLPQYQRASYLAGAHPMLANAMVGPYGAAVMAALEHGLAGDSRGWQAIKSLNPITFVQEMIHPDTFREAAGLIGRAEGTALGTNPSVARQIIHTPGTFMTAGDITARRFLERAGFSPEEARRITMTSEPDTALGKETVNWGRNSVLGQLLFPFRRTPMNIMEQGAQRLPGIGIGAQASRISGPDSGKLQLVQQLLGTGVGVGSGVLGANVDPETGKTVRKYLTNFAGQYALPASIGFAAGQALQKGKSPIGEGVVQGLRDIPIPATDSLEQLITFLQDPVTNIQERKNIPTNVVPKFVQELLGGPEPKYNPLKPYWRK